MLSYQQFLGKHPVKFRGLSAQQKRTRYQDYVRSQRNAGNNQPPPRRRGRARGRTQANPPPVSNRLGCESRYLAMYARPFDSDTVGLPVFPSPPSAKHTAWCRGVAAVGTSGYGCVYGSPVIVSDITCVHYSKPDFAAARFDTGIAGTASTGFTNLPISSPSLTETSGIRGRVALCALRIRYVGTQNNLGGTIYPYVHPLHQEIHTKDLTWLASQEDFTSLPVTRQWTTITWTPVHRSELEYYHTTYPPSHGNVEAENAASPMGILFTGTPGNTFEFQWILHVEYTGQQTTWLAKTDNEVSINLADYVDKLQAPKYSLRGTGAPGTATNISSLFSLIAPALKTAASQAITSAARSAIFGADLR